MNIFEKRSTKLLNQLKLLLPAFLLIVICIVFLFSIHTTSKETLSKQQQTLTDALCKGAVHTYSLEGRYPENLAQLLEDYHITYDQTKFIVEYVPSGSNLFPMISVLPRSQKKGGS